MTKVKLLNQRFYKVFPLIHSQYSQNLVSSSGPLSVTQRYALALRDIERARTGLVLASCYDFADKAKIVLQLSVNVS